jgi:hypothetical protein
MDAKTYRCPKVMLALLLAGAVAIGFLSTDTMLVGLPPSSSVYFIVVSTALVLYAFSIAPTRLVLSDDGLWQKTMFSELRLRWDDMVEWRHCEEGPDFEAPEKRASTMGKWHGKEIWIRDKSGRKHYLKRWLVFGKRSRQLADWMRSKGIQGG